MSTVRAWLRRVGVGRDRDAPARGERLELERDTAVGRFPAQNPNPVMRVSSDGRLAYANDASGPILEALGIDVGDMVPPDVLGDIRQAATADPVRNIEIECDRRTFALTAVTVQGHSFLNLYGTDVTAMKVIAKFPLLNPNPVMRMSADGRLLYANAASQPIVEALGVAEGDPFPPGIAASIRRSCAATGEVVEVQGDGHIYALSPVDIRELDFTNIYATDITAMRALDKFPDANPNPVLRISRAGRLLYANPAARPVREALGAEVGEELEPAIRDRIQRMAEEGSTETIEIQRHGRTWALLIMPVFEFEAVNMYGTEITAVRALELAHRENERLLHNILPESIASRMRGGELTIADQFDEMTVMFADVVGFTQLSMALAPAELIAMLNDVFSRCDALADRFGLEKIKTIGDAYMVVGGLMSHEIDEAERVADMGLEMIEAVDRYATETGIDLRIRVGLHTGPAVAGVAGVKKFIYDVWGDTVNTASRMESHGVPGHIQVTEATYQRLNPSFEFTERGEVDIRGKGVMTTYLLLRRREDGQDGRRADSHDLSRTG
jgi:class 3 adenylate cyclase